MRIWPLFLRTSGSSGVLKALLLERNRQLSCNPKKKNVLQMRSFRLGIGSDWQCYIAFGPQLGSLPLLQMALLLLGPLLLLRRLILI